MSVNELQKQLAQLEQETGDLRQRIDALLPPPVKQDGWEFSITRKGGIRVNHGDVFGGKDAPSTTAEVAIKLRDMLVSVHPLDTAPDAGWVSVEERLPDATRNVLVLILDIDTPLVAYRRNGFWINYFGGGVMKANVTHWRELPAPPANEGSKP